MASRRAFQHQAQLDVVPWRSTSRPASSRSGGGTGGGSTGALLKEPLSLEALQRQLQDGELDIAAVEALLDQMMSISGVMRLARAHSAHLRGYALLAQNLLDDATACLEALWAMAAGQDALAAAWFYGACLAALAFCCYAGLGWGVYIALWYLLRPPFLRGVPGVWGFRAFFSNLPARRPEDFM